MRRWTTADILTGAGILAVSGGVACVYPPAGLITLGVLAAVVGIALDIEQARKRKKP